MKFFFLKKKQTKKLVYFNNSICVDKNKHILQTNTILGDFNGILTKKGLSTMYKNILVKIFLNINVFLFFNKKYLYTNYQNTSWVFDNIFEKKINYQIIFDGLVNLLKPPFIIKSLLVSKKLKKKLKIKYTIKIVYKKDDKRIKNSLKQIYYNSNNYLDNKIGIRLYKSMLLSVLE